MPRYIDADEALRMMRNSKQDNPCNTPGKGIWKTAHDCCMSCVDSVSTADVVPKSEVERLNKKIDVLKRDRYQVFPDGRLELLPRTDLDKIKAEVAREIFEAVLDVYKNTCDADFEEEFAELKKKYTEGENQCADERG